jgi:predicted metal-dependent hydrolase
MQLGLPFTSTAERELERPERPERERFEPFEPFERYYIRHRRARRYVLRLDHDGRVRITIPRGGSRREADAFAERQAEWIQRRLEAHRQAQATRPAISVDERGRLRALAKEVLPPRLRALAAEHGLTVSRITIRDQRSRWGSCGRDGHICLNWRLVQMPERIRDYVMVHELMHLRRMDHSPKYWRLVAAAFPDYQEARAWLRRHGPGLR